MGGWFAFVRIPNELHKCISVFLMFDNVVSKAHENILIKMLGLAAHLWMTRYCCKLINAGDGAHHRKTFADKFSTIISNFIHLDFTDDKSMIKEDIINVSSCCLGRLFSFIQPGVSFCNKNYAYVTLHFFGAWFHDIHREKVEWSRGWKEL